MSSSPFWKPKPEPGAFTTPTGAGKEPGGGGTLSNKGVGIIEINVPNDLGGIDKCGGRIGKASLKKMCIKENCDVASHRNNPIKLGDDIQGFTLFIQAGDNAVFCEPTLPAYLLGDSLESYRYVKMEVEKWDALFTLHRHGEGGATAKEWEETVKDFGEKLSDVNAIGLGKTPFKRRPKMEVKASPLADDFEKLNIGIEKELPRSGNLEENLRQQWRVLAQVVQNLEEQMSSFKDRLKEMGIETKTELGNIDLAIFLFKSLLGERDPVIFGKSSVFELIEEFFEELSDVQNELNTIRGTGNSNGGGFLSGTSIRRALNIQDPLVEIITYDSMKEHLDFVLEFVNNWSNYSSGVGGELKDRLRDLQDQITKFDQQLQNLEHIVNLTGPVAPSGAAATGASTGPSLFRPRGFVPPKTNVQNQGGTAFTATHMNVTGVSSSGPPSVDPQVLQMITELRALVQDQGAELIALKSELREANVKIQQLQDESTSTAVVVSTITFPTYKWAEGWLGVNVHDPSGFVFFVDPHSMLQMIYDSFGRTTAIDLKMRVDASRTGAQSMLEPSVSTSFSNATPLIFGGPTNAASALAQDSRILQAVSTYDKWGDVGAYDGAARVLSEKTREMKETLLEQVGYHLSEPALGVAKSMIDNTAIFLHRLGEWITHEFMILRNRGTDKTIAWLLISQLIVALFKELHFARRSGRTSDLNTSSKAAMFWGCLQGFGRMEKFLINDFDRDQSLSSALFLHLRDNSMSKADKEKLSKEIADVRKELAVIKTTADSAASKAARAMDSKGKKTAGSKGGGSKGGANKEKDEDEE